MCSKLSLEINNIVKRLDLSRKAKPFSKSFSIFINAIESIDILYLQDVSECELKIIDKSDNVTSIILTRLGSFENELDCICLIKKNYLLLERHFNRHINKHPELKDRYYYFVAKFDNQKDLIDLEDKAPLIHNEFINLFYKTGLNRHFKVEKWFEGSGSVSDNIIDINGSLNFLLYFRIRSEKPYTWEATKNRIQELRHSGRKWFFVLLFETANTGYFLTSDDVDNYIYKNIWPLKNNGAYGVQTGKYLQFNQPFYSFHDLLYKIEQN